MTAWSINAEEYPFSEVRSIFVLGTKVDQGERPTLIPNCKMNPIIEKSWENVNLSFFITNINNHFIYYRIQKIVQNLVE